MQQKEKPKWQTVSRPYAARQASSERRNQHAASHPPQALDTARHGTHILHTTNIGEPDTKPHWKTTKHHAARHPPGSRAGIDQQAVSKLHTHRSPSKQPTQQPARGVPSTTSSRHRAAWYSHSANHQHRRARHEAAFENDEAPRGASSARQQGGNRSASGQQAAHTPLAKQAASAGTSTRRPIHHQL